MVNLGPALKEWQEKDMEHLRYEYDLKLDDLVLDIGSYRREFADEIARRYGCKVECFDALDNRAAWTFNGQLEMGGQYYYTSAYDKSGPTQKYDCVDIAPFLKKEIALLKMNIEGGEYDLLDYIYYQCSFTGIKNLQIQFHHVEGREWEISYAAIAHKLAYTHELTWRVPFVWENWRRKE